jgi:WD40 repeat protein
MKQVFFFLFCTAFFISVKGQSNYDEAVQLGDEALKNKDYKNAINKYFAAEAFDPAKKDLIKVKVNLVFDRIVALKAEAENAKSEAEKQTRIARANYLVSEANRLTETNPTLSLRIIENVLNKYSSNDKFVKDANKIYKENIFYKVIANCESRWGANYLAFSPDGKAILIKSLDDATRLYYLEGHIINDFYGDINSSSFSPDGKYILTASVHYYDDIPLNIRNSAILRNLKGDTIKVFTGHTAKVRSLVFSPNGNTILTGSDDSTARLWDIKNGKPIIVFIGNTGPVQSVAFSPDGKTVLTVCKDTLTIFSLWDLDGRIIRKFDDSLQHFNSIGFSSDGKTIYAVSEEAVSEGTDPGTFFHMWDLEGHRIKIKNFRGIHTIKGTESSVLSPDGKTILTASDDVADAPIYDRNICILRNLIGETISTFRGHVDMVTSLAFSFDGEHILTGSFDSTVRLWDLHGNTIQLLRGHSGPILSVAFSPDGKKIATSGFDQTVRLWDLGDKMPLTDFLKSDKIEPLSAEQKKQYGIKE